VPAHQLIINHRPYETRVAALEDGRLVELYIERDSFRDIVGNIYKGKVVRVLPGIQAAFVDIGIGRTGFLCIQDLPKKDAKIEDVIFELAPVYKKAGIEFHQAYFVNFRLNIIKNMTCLFKK